MSRTFSFKAVQKIPVAADQAWEFFSDPANLALITPANLDFRIISAHHGETMYAGQLIEYRVRPLLGISVYWMTEITHVEQGRYFVDEQRYGPYELWHHQHHFEAVAGGVLMTDIVHYRLPWWLPAALTNRLVVKSRLKAIFDHRYSAVEARFGNWVEG